MSPAATARIVAAVGAVVRAEVPPTVAVNDVIRVGPQGLLGEVIGLEQGVATIQVYEETDGLQVGDAVEPAGTPLLALLGPGLLGSTYDGLQRPLDALAAAGIWRLVPGLGGAGEVGEPGPGAALGAARAAQPASKALLSPLARDRRWAFTPERSVGEVVGPGDVLGTVPEGPLRHRILVPPDARPGRLLALEAGTFTVAEPIGRIAGPSGEVPLRLSHAWPMRRRRPVAARLAAERPFVTGQRVLDTLYPVAVGGTAVIPGGFGTGKTVVEQALARWSDADVVVYVGCGERGNEIAELLATFPELVDPRTGGPLLARTVLVANTSNMPVAAREASIQLGITIAEYFRDQGLSVALLADSTSRWAEALREISGRLEELPGEEGYPAYLASRLAAFYEAAGRVRVLGSPEREGAVTLVGAVSPPGGDFSEPVTQASLRLAGTFWSLDAELAHARHFPAISWERVLLPRGRRAGAAGLPDGSTRRGPTCGPISWPSWRASGASSTSSSWSARTRCRTTTAPSSPPPASSARSSSSSTPTIPTTRPGRSTSRWRSSARSSPPATRFSAGQRRGSYPRNRPRTRAWPTCARRRAGAGRGRLNACAHSPGASRPTTPRRGRCDDPLAAPAPRRGAPRRACSS